jgi:arylsulfatase A-like enzyme
MTKISECRYNRKQFISQLLAGLGGTLVYGCTGHANKSLPNIVLIISDDQAWSDYGFMGHPVIRTPNLDKLASQSLVFTRGYVAAPLCGPSLASIITGLHPHQHKFTSNDPPFEQGKVNANTKEWPAERRQMREKIISDFAKLPVLPSELQKSGYLRMQTGKWWMGSYHNGGFTHGMTLLRNADKALLFKI